jgi:hypothetical protein
VTITKTEGQGTPIGARDVSFKASEVMATRYVAVMLTSGTPGYVSLATDGAEAIGILQTKAAAIGDAVTVRVQGKTLCKMNTTCSVGDHLNSAASTGLLAIKGSTEYFIAIALEAATAQNDEILAEIVHAYV